MKWQERLLKEAEDIVDHGQGKLTLNVGPVGKDQVNILIEAGKSHRFIEPRVDKILRADL